MSYGGDGVRGRGHVRRTEGSESGLAKQVCCPERQMGSLKHRHWGGMHSLWLDRTSA